LTLISRKYQASILPAEVRAGQFPWIVSIGRNCFSGSVRLMPIFWRGKRRGLDLGDQKAPIFQLVLHRRGICLVDDDSDARFIRPRRMPVTDRPTHPITSPKPFRTGCLRWPISTRFGIYLSGAPTLLDIAAVDRHGRTVAGLRPKRAAISSGPVPLSASAWKASN
jgi:hypothetical protein